MRRLLSAFISAFAILSPAGAQDVADGVDVKTLDTVNLPVVTVETVDGEVPTFDKIYPPEGSIGASITNATKVPGRVTVTLLGDTLYDSGDYMKNESGMTIKVRGNTSAYSEKRPYKIKLQKKADMLSRGDDAKYKDKNWVLLNSGYTLKTMAALKLSSFTDIQWSPALQYVNLVFNGDYRGVYILIEAVERNENCRLDVSETEGYVVEMDPYWWKEDVYFDTHKTDLVKKYTFKYPDADDVTPEQVANIKSYIEASETAIDNGTYDEYIDVHSFALWLLLHDILGTYDSGGSNIFVTRRDNSSKLMMGNIWDFDTVLSMGDDWARVHYDFFYYDLLFKSANKAFVREYVRLWNEHKDTIFDRLFGEMEAYSDSDEGRALELSLSLEDKRWHGEWIPVEDQVSDMKTYLTKRKAWLSAAIDNLQTTLGVDMISGKAGKNAPRYNIYGMKVDDSYKGIVIYDGKKMIVK